MPANNITLDLVGAFNNLQDLGVSKILFDAVILGNARATKQLHRIRRHLNGHVGGKQLGHGGYRRQFLASYARVSFEGIEHVLGVFRFFVNGLGPGRYLFLGQSGVWCPGGVVVSRPV